MTRSCCLHGYSARNLRRKVPKLLESVLRLGEGKRQLNRAWEHLIGCGAIYEMMFFSREVSVANYYEALSRIDELYGALSEMRDRPVVEWDRVEVVPWPRHERPEDDPIIQDKLREREETEKRVDEILKETLPYFRPQPSPKAQPKIEVVEAPAGRKRPPPKWLN